MGANSKIEWTDSSWNPVSGCTPISPGCAHCYAKCIAERFAGGKAYPDGFAVTLHPDKLEEPLHWRKPRMVFVCSMGDLFHDDVPDDFIDRVFTMMALCPQHTFQVLTKRVERMQQYLSNYGGVVSPGLGASIHWPYSHVWLGVTSENQEQADKRIPLLLQTPAAVRFVSIEPLLSPIDLLQWLVGGATNDGQREGISCTSRVGEIQCRQGRPDMEARRDGGRQQDGGGLILPPVSDTQASRNECENRLPDGDVLARWAAEIRCSGPQDCLDGSKSFGDPGFYGNSPQGLEPHKPSSGKLGIGNTVGEHLTQLSRNSAQEESAKGRDERFSQVDSSRCPENQANVQRQGVAAIKNSGDVRDNAIGGILYPPSSELGTYPRLDWVIVGGETGPGARPMHPDWARSLRDQCQAAGVPFFFKSWGEWWPSGPRIVENAHMVMFGNDPMYRVGKKAAGHLLDGVEWRQTPQKEASPC